MERDEKGARGCDAWDEGHLIFKQEITLSFAQEISGMIASSFALENI